MNKESSLRERILQILSDSKNIISGYDSVSLSDSLANSEERLSEPMQLAIIGKISSSKSTLVNAILGESEVVRTGQMEETFNVSWLKYGDSDSDIKVVFKNGDVSMVPRTEWKMWTSHQEENKLKEQVKYIEVLYNHEILKDINIIDTPGLDALSQIDSKNTIAFLKEVKPDAIVMLFTKSIAESTLSVLQDFQSVGSSNFNLSALNAIGVLAKVDTMWSSINPQKNILSEANRVINSTLFDKYPEVRKSLFTILPVSSLMGLASLTITNTDVVSLTKLTMLESVVLNEMLSSPAFFIDEDYKTDLTVNERKRLYEKFGLYGIYVLTEAINRNKDATVDFLGEVLRSKSGFDKLLFTIQSHFGGRSTLIKSQNILQELLHKISLCKYCCSGNALVAVSKVENLIVTALLTMHEYQEWEYLSKYYDGKLSIDADVAEEFASICGERGYSARERLRCEDIEDSKDLLKIAKDRALYWQKQYNIFSVIEPELGNFYKVLISSYNILLQEIKQATFDYENAKETIIKTSAFLGLNKVNKTQS